MVRYVGDDPNGGLVDEKGMLPTALAEGLNPDTGFNDGIARDPNGKPLAAGQTSGNTGFDPATYLKLNPDVQAEYDRVIKVADRNSPFFAEHGLESPETFAAWHYQTYGKNENRPGGGGTAVGNTTGTVAQGNDLTTSLTSGFNDAIKALQDSTTTQVNQLNQNNSDLTKQIMDMQTGFQTSQQQLLDNLNKTAAAQSQQFTQALKDLKDAGNSTGQAAKKPNYARALARNRDLNSQGLGSTMLTGPGGTQPGNLSLGATSLLGA
ncbi:hypothetical protein UFOVP1324_16 [uncultured Caudovirales phage]|uniref:Uncharacterized protein n=1 Tax=uncultured Caudovirales phage TaxID=2100421 RepID=A0A6J5RNW8_9CAUD|nr:hypothetical protein UFOVP1324_16 [uncultured Caudovirales phage]